MHGEQAGAGECGDQAEERNEQADQGQGRQADIIASCTIISALPCKPHSLLLQDDCIQKGSSTTEA